MILLLLACAPTSTDTADTADDGPKAETNWYFGTSQGQTPDGSYVEEAEDILFIRALDPAASTVTEDAWSPATKKTWTHYSLVHAVDAEAGTFTAEFVTADGTLDVVGAYDAGEPWAWTAWHSTSTYRDGEYAGMVVASTDHVDEDGSAHAAKTITDADGVEIWLIAEDLTPTTQEEFEAEEATLTVE